MIEVLQYTNKYDDLFEVCSFEDSIEFKICSSGGKLLHFQVKKEDIGELIDYIDSATKPESLKVLNELD